MRTKKGIIGSTKMTNTVSVIVDRSLFHPIYKKRFKRNTKFLADTNGHDLFVGDEVEITECAPLSKRKYFKVTQITKAAPRIDDINDENDQALAQRRTKDVPETPKKQKVLTPTVS